MHILLIHQAFVPLDEAGGTRHHELALHLARKGHRVTVIASPVSYLTGKVSTGEQIIGAPLAHPTKAGKASTTQAKPVETEEGGGRVSILRTYTYTALHRSFVHRMLSFFSFMLSSFWAGLKVREVDLVWGTSPPIFQGVTAWGLARLKGVPFLFEVRDLWPAFAVEVGVLHQPLLIRLSEWLERSLYRQADRVVVNSPGFVEHVQRRGARQIDLVPNGAEASMFDPQADGAEFRRKNGLEGKFVALYAGAHGLSNDLGIVLQAAGRLKERGDIAIVLLGDGKDKPALQAQAAEMGLDNLHFLAPVPKNRMAEALAGSQACIAILKPIPLYATVYPNKVFDYMAAGRPVLLAIDGVIRQVVEEAGAGIYVPPGDPQKLAEAIVRLADDPELGCQMGRRGRECIEQRFERGVVVEKLRQVIEEMGAGRKNGG